MGINGAHFKIPHWGSIWSTLMLILHAATFITNRTTVMIYFRYFFFKNKRGRGKEISKEIGVSPYFKFILFVIQFSRDFTQLIDNSCWVFFLLQIIINVRIVFGVNIQINITVIFVSHYVHNRNYKQIFTTFLLYCYIQAISATLYHTIKSKIKYKSI